MVLKKSAITFFFIFLSFSNAFAYRPLSTEDAGVAGKGVFQTEISWDYLKWDNDDVDHILLFVPVYGLTERVELSLEVPYVFHDPDEGGSEDGVGDINIAGKYLVFGEGEKNPAFVIKGVVKTESGDFDKGLGSADVDYSLVAAASKTLGPFTLHGQLGYTWVGDDKDNNLGDITVYGIAMDYAATESFHAVAELNGFKHPDRTVDRDPVDVLIGFIYGVSGNLTFDAAMRRGLNDSSPDWGTTVGFSISY